MAALISARLAQEATEATAAYKGSSATIGYFVIDDLLPAETARAIADAFPAKEAMVAKRSMRERKAILAQMTECNPLIGEAIYAFQDPEVVSLIAKITGAPSVEPDPLLYAGGISAMSQGDFLNPHLDNSHDKDRQRWRALNLLYYVTPDWPEDSGGNLELWPDGVGSDQITIHSRFNRLVVMATHGHSWHSVSPVSGDGLRRCVSNYYFTPEPMLRDDRFHVTSFRAPGSMVDAALRLDSFARTAVRIFRPSGMGQTRHFNSSAH